MKNYSLHRCTDNVQGERLADLETGGKRARCNADYRLSAGLVCSGIVLRRTQIASRITAWARLTIASIEGVSANMASARATMIAR
jgi:hypothetical protein